MCFFTTFRHLQTKTATKRRTWWKKFKVCPSFFSRNDPVFFVLPLLSFWYQNLDFYSFYILLFYTAHNSKTTNLNCSCFPLLFHKESIFDMTLSLRGLPLSDLLIVTNIGLLKYIPSLLYYTFIYIILLILKLSFLQLKFLMDVSQVSHRCNIMFITTGCF